ncbi:hypothetical protein AMTRI_Chr11g93420 [Amborella trichopoda]
MAGFDAFSTYGEDPRTNASRPFDDDDDFPSQNLQSPPLPIYGFLGHQQPKFPDFSPHSSVFAELLKERESRALSFLLIYEREKKETRESREEREERED